MDRPALQQLLADIDAGDVDCVVVYKVDRLSRSLLDFARLMEVFEQKSISFVSTTQQFNTATPLGRLTLHLLLSFAQFEREMISERTRDKLAAARRRGKWIGGKPVLGYRVNETQRKLEIIPEEAQQVRAIFDIYLRTRSVTAVTQQVDAFGWRKKSYETKSGTTTGGGRFERNTIHRILRNRIYTGQVVYKGEIHEGEHDAIINLDTFEKTQAIIDLKRCGRGQRRQRNFAYILQGLLFCACKGKMTTVNGKGRNGTVYRYYHCYSQTRGVTSSCTHPRVPACEIEPFVIERIRTICVNEAMRKDIAARLQTNKEQAVRAMTFERNSFQKKIDALEEETRQLSMLVNEPPHRLQEIEQDIDEKRRQAQQLDEQIEKLNANIRRIRNALELLDNFTEVWDVLIPEERCDLVKLLIERIDVDIPNSKLRITFRDLLEELPSPPKVDLPTETTSPS